MVRRGFLVGSFALLLLLAFSTTSFAGEEQPDGKPAPDVVKPQPKLRVLAVAVVAPKLRVLAVAAPLPRRMVVAVPVSKVIRYRPPPK